VVFRQDSQKRDVVALPRILLRLAESPVPLDLTQGANHPRQDEHYGKEASVDREALHVSIEGCGGL
jgi:hypothetical protein